MEHTNTYRCTHPGLVRLDGWRRDSAVQGSKKSQGPSLHTGHRVTGRGRWPGRVRSENLN